MVDDVDDPAKMPLLVEPVEEHPWVQHFPTAPSSDGTETTHRASDDLTTVASEPPYSPSWPNEADRVGGRNDSSSATSFDTIF